MSPIIAQIGGFFIILFFQESAIIILMLIQILNVLSIQVIPIFGKAARTFFLLPVTAIVFSFHKNLSLIHI